MTDQPCRFCGSTELERRYTAFDWEELNELAIEEWADEVGCVEMIECRACVASAPVQTWNRDPWRYPPEMPEIDDRVLLTYRPLGGEESRPITSTYYDGYEDDSHPIVRWMPIPEICK